tara:strand:- start:35 stop:301 length:267 start_codon:yes stop_codon:yes gene_type:complete
MNVRFSYLIFLSFVFFTSCTSSQKQNNICQEDCKKWCSVGCYASEGPTKCLYLEDGSMPCCEALAKGMSLEEFKLVVFENNYRKCNFK